MAARDVCPDGDRHKEAEGVSQGGGHEACRGGGAVICQLGECHAGALAGKDKDEGGKELCQPRLEGVRVGLLLWPADGDVTDRHDGTLLLNGGGGSRCEGVSCAVWWIVGGWGECFILEEAGCWELAIAGFRWHSIFKNILRELTLIPI